MVKRAILFVCEGCKKEYKKKTVAEDCEISHYPDDTVKEMLEEKARLKLKKNWLNFDITMALCYRKKEPIQPHPDNIAEPMMFYFPNDCSYLARCIYTDKFVSLSWFNCPTCEHCFDFSAYERWIKCGYKQEYEYHI